MNKSSTKPPFVEQQYNEVRVRAKFIDAPSSPAQHSETVAATSQHGNDPNNELLYFDLQLERPGFEPDKKTKEYLDFQIQGDFKILKASDTLLPLLVHRIANGRKEVYEYMVVFKRVDVARDPKANIVIMYDDQIFGLGKQLFEFKTSDLITKRKAD